MPIKSKPKSGHSFNSYVKYSNMAFQMAIIIGGGTYLGLRIDKSVHAEFPWATLSFSLLSVFLAMYISIKEFIKPPKKQ